MVIENQIPKTEMVYELKDEYQVPSFEEFMKTYENDGNLNYDDLSGGDVGEVKGYGPCSPSYCRGCDCERSNCNCETGERYIKLRMPCPAVKKEGDRVIRCSNGVYDNPTYWVHSTDSYYTWISNHANIRCEKSYCPATNKMQNWKFLCSNHSFHNGKYEYASTGTWIDIVTTAGRVWGDKKLVGELLAWLNKEENYF